MGQAVTKASAITNRGLLIGIPLFVSLVFSGAYSIYLAPRTVRTRAHTGGSTSIEAKNQNASPITVATPHVSPLTVQAPDATAKPVDAVQTTAPTDTLQKTGKASTNRLLKTLTNLMHVPTPRN